MTCALNGVKSTLGTYPFLGFKVSLQSPGLNSIDSIRDKIVTMQLSATVSHQIVHHRSPEEQFHSFSTIGEEELYKLVKSSKPTTCMLDPIPSKLLKELLPEVIDPLLAIINSSLSLGYVPKTFKLAVIKPLIKKPQLDPKDLVNYRLISNPFSVKDTRKGSILTIIFLLREK